MHTPGPWSTEIWSYDNGKRLVPTVQTSQDAIAQDGCDVHIPVEAAEAAIAKAEGTIDAP
jgi:hypothetical protein